MQSKELILQKISRFLSQERSSFGYRICKLLKDGDFEGALSSQALAGMLNEMAGKKFQVNSLTALMQPFLREDIVKSKIVNEKGVRRKVWIPGWLDKKQIGLNGEDILFFSGKNCWTDPNRNFPKVIEHLKGDLCIVDPYYGNGTFDILEKFGKKTKVRFLSSRLGDEEQNNSTKFDNNLKRFKREFVNIEIRKYDKFYEIHDRYIISDNSLVIIGHGIKDLAGKESFVVFLREALVGSFLPSLRLIFEDRWRKSKKI